MSDYTFHTVTHQCGNVNGIATQRVADINGKPYHIGDYDYVILMQGHIRATGKIMTGKDSPLVEGDIKKIVDRFIAEGQLL